MINYGRHSIDKKDIQAVIKVLKSDYLTQGPVVQKFESKLSTYFKSKFALTVSSGTSALNIAAKVLGWKKGDLVFVSPITFLASANCIVQTGATPKFVDINLEDYSIDLDLLEIKLKKNKKKNKALVITDYAGHPSDWQRINKIKNQYNLQVINDNCHSMGAKINGNKGYATKYSDFSILSFHPVKVITAGEGGALLTNNHKYFHFAKELRSHGVVRDKKKIKQIGNWYYEMKNLGGNSRLSDIHASLGCSQLSKLDKFVKRRNKIAKFYNKIFKNNSLFNIPKLRKNIYHAYHIYPLLVDFEKLKISRNKIFQIFKKNKINLQVHYIPINMQPYYKKKFGFKGYNYVNSIKFYQSEISLPIYYDLNLKKLNYIKKICRQAFKI